MIKKLLERTIARLHSNEGGAVALLCLAAILILFMCVLVMFDASQATQAKIDVQMGADTAAYSAGAQGARAMNMVSFANVGKRTALGINNMYIYNYDAYIMWVGIMCGCCCNCTWCACPDFKCCFNCAGNIISFIPVMELIDMLKYISGNDIWKNMEELDAFQEAVKPIGKVWANAEAQVRGIRNNANMMVVWPDPIMSDDKYTELPYTRSDYISEACLAYVPLLGRNPTTTNTNIEWIVNWRVLIDNSTSSPNIASDGPKEVVEGSAYKFGWYNGLIGSIMACKGNDWKFFPVMGIFGMLAQLLMPDEAAPMFLDVPNSDDPWENGDDHLRMSYMMYSYKHTPEFGNGGKQREKYNFMTKEYTKKFNIPVINQQPETGMWGMARGEFYFPPASMPSTWPLADGEHKMWMFHPGWMGKLRPTHLPYESAQADGNQWQIEMDEMVQESMFTGAVLANTVFGMSGVPNYNGGGFINDLMYLRFNVAPDMKGMSTFSSGDPHHYMDGMVK